MNKAFTFEQAQGYVSRIGKKGSILGLETMTLLMKEMGDVQNQVPTIHIAGTNGKGSVSAYLTFILKEAGYRVGRYSSPAVFDNLEIITVDGQNITEEHYAEGVWNVKSAIERMVEQGYPEPTAFELETTLAFWYFKKADCDIAIIECGMGGATDATNVIAKPVAEILMPVSLDHMGFLGDTIEKIAKVKAGIVKAGTEVVVAGQECPQTVRHVVEEQAERMRANVVFCKEVQDVSYGLEHTVFSYTTQNGNEYHNLWITMLGTFQPDNAAPAIECVEILKRGGFRIDNEHVRRGLSLARWPGRFEQICTAPKIYLDGCHNPGAAKRLYQTIEYHFTNKKIIYIIGVLADKDYREEIRILAPLASEIFTVTPNVPRGLSGEVLAEVVKKEYPGPVTYVNDFQKAVELAAKSAKNVTDEEPEAKEGVVIVFGSLSYLKDIREGINSEK